MSGPIASGIHASACTGCNAAIAIDISARQTDWPWTIAPPGFDPPAAAQKIGEKGLDIILQEPDPLKKVRMPISVPHCKREIGVTHEARIRLSADDLFQAASGAYELLEGSASISSTLWEIDRT